MERVGLKNKWAITNYELFAWEYLKRRVLWDKSATYQDKQDALHSLTHAVNAKFNTRAMFGFCLKFRKMFEKRVKTYLQICIEKKLPPEFALKRSGVQSWIKEVDYHLKYLDQLINEFRESGELPPLSNRHLVWSAFVNKMADHCRLVRRLPNENDVATVVSNLGWSSEYCEALERLWKINLSSSLYKHRRVSLLGHKTLCLSALEWTVVDLALLYTIPTLSAEATFKNTSMVKQLVRLCHLIKLHNIEVDDGVNPKHKWAKVVRQYSREYETSPSGINLQLYWHSLRQFARTEVMCRLTDAKRKVHPLLVEIATKYPNLLEDDTPWLEKVNTGKVYDVSNVRIVYAGPDEGKKKTAAQKKLEKENFYDSDDEKALVIDEPSTSKAKKKSAEPSMPSLENATVLSVDEPQNDDVIILSDDSCSQFSCTNGDNNPQSAESSNTNCTVPNTVIIKMKLDNLDKDLKKLEKEITKEFLTLKNLKSSENDNDDNTDWELCIIKRKSDNDENISQQSTKTKADVAVGKLSSKSKNATDDKIAKKSVKSTNSTKKEAILATNTSKRKESNNVVENKTTLNLKPTDKNTKPKVTDDKELNKQPVIQKSSQSCETVIQTNVHVDDPSTTKVSDLELLKKIDPTQAETTIIFDSDSEEDLAKVVGNDQEKKVYNLNDVKQYLSHFSLDDILTKMGDVQVKEEPKQNFNRKVCTFTSISLSDSDEKSIRNGIQDDECVDITNHSSEDEEFKAITSKIDVSIEKIVPYKNMIRSSINFEDKEMVENIHKDTSTNKTKVVGIDKNMIRSLINYEDNEMVENIHKDTSTNKTKVVSVDDIPMMKIAKQLNNENPNPIVTSNQEVHNKTNKFGNRPKIKGRRRLQEYVEHSDGLSLFKLQDRKTKETVGVLVNAKNAMKVTDLDVGVCKKVDSYLYESTDKSEENLKSTEEIKEENENTLNKEQDERANDKELFWNNLLDSSNTKPLLTEKVEEQTDKEEEIAESEVSIDPKLIMDTRVYLPKIDEVDGYIKNRRFDNSINIKRFNEQTLEILNYKRKSEATELVHDDIDSEILESSKIKVSEIKESENKVDDENILEKRIKLNVEECVATYSRVTNKRKTTDNTKSATEHVPANLRSDLINSLPETIRNEIVLDALDKIKNGTSANITKRIKFESDEETQNDDFDANVQTNNDIPLKIEKPLISDVEMDIDNDCSTLDTQNEINNSLTVDKNDGIDSELKIKLELMDMGEISSTENVKSHIDESSSGSENVNLENVPSLNDFTEINDNSDMDMKVESAKDDEKTHQLSDDDSKPINNIEEMLKLCKPVKLCLKKVKVPSQSQVRKVELPDRSSLHKHRAPTAHVAPIHVVPREGQGGDDRTKQDIGTLLHQLSMETASEWQRLEESILNPQQIKKRPGDHTNTKRDKDKVRRSYKKKEKINFQKEKPPAPDVDELTLQNKEWERQKTMNKRFFDLAPKYAKTSANAAKNAKDKPEKTPENIEKVLKNTDDKNDNLEGVNVGQKQMGPSETELAVESLIKENNATKEKEMKADSGFCWLTNLKRSLDNVENNYLRPIFTKVERKNELTPIATKAVNGNDSSNEVITKIVTLHKNPDTDCSKGSKTNVSIKTHVSLPKNDANTTKKKFTVYFPSTSGGQLKKQTVCFTLNKGRDDAPKANVVKEPQIPNWLRNLNVRAFKTKRKEVTGKPKETIVLEDSDEDDNSKVANKTKENDNETNSNPPVKVLESTLRKTGTSHLYKVMEIRPMEANVEENKKSSEEGEKTSNVTPDPPVDIDDTERQTFKREPRKQLIINLTPIHKHANMQMPKIVSTSSLRDNDIDESKGELKPINSEDECMMDSDSDDLHIDETVNSRDVDYMETDLDSEDNENSTKNTQDTNNIINDDDIEMGNESLNKTSESLNITSESLNITSESNQPQANLTYLTEIDKVGDKNSTQENEPNVDSKIENVTPNTSQENSLTDNKNSVSNTIDENSTDDVFESNSISTKEVIIKENVTDSPKTDTNVEISDENKATVDNKDSPKDDSETQTNTKKIEVSNENKTDTPRPFLKLVPIQQLLDDKKSEVNKSTEFDENIDKGINNDDESQIDDQLDSIDDELNLGDETANRIRGAPIPFLCSTKSADVTEDRTVPKISNVISLSGISILKKKPVLLNDLFLKNTPVPGTSKTTEAPKPAPSKSNTDNKLNYINLSIKPPVLVAEYIRDRDCTDLAMLCVDRGQPLWQVNSDYLITTNVKLSFHQPSYWSTDAREKRVRVFVDRSSKGSAVVEGMSIPDEVFIETNWYKKLSNDPVIYAKILYVVPNPTICQNMINQNIQLYLYSNTTGAMMPLLVQQNSNTNKKTLVPILLNVVDVAKKTSDVNVINLDSDDE